MLIHMHGSGACVDAEIWSFACTCQHSVGMSIEAHTAQEASGWPSQQKINLLNAQPLRSQPTMLRASHLPCFTSCTILPAGVSRMRTRPLPARSLRWNCMPRTLDCSLRFSSSARGTSGYRLRFRKPSSSYSLQIPRRSIR